MVLLCSCGNYSKVSVNGTKIRKGTYAYFLDRAKTENSEISSEEQIKIANDSISEYVAVNSEFVNRNLTLSTAKKADVSQNVDSYWNLFSDYYNKIGVSKQDLYEIEQSKAFREALMSNYYSSDGELPVSEEELKNYFNNNFVAFRVITGYLTTVDTNNNTVTLSEADKQTKIESFKKLSNQINEQSTSFDEVGAYTENVLVTSETQVISKDDSKYPKGFYEQLIGIEVDKAGSFSIDSYVYIVQRTDITNEELQLFTTHKSEALKVMKGEEFNSVVKSWAENYIVS